MEKLKLVFGIEIPFKLTLTKGIYPESPELNTVRCKKCDRTVVGQVSSNCPYCNSSDIEYVTYVSDTLLTIDTIKQDCKLSSLSVLNDTENTTILYVPNYRRYFPTNVLGNNWGIFIIDPKLVNMVIETLNQEYKEEINYIKSLLGEKYRHLVKFKLILIP